MRLRSLIPIRAGRIGGAHKAGHSVEEITGLSRDTIKRRYPHLIKKPSVRREGMELGDALAIACGEAEPSGA